MCTSTLEYEKITNILRQKKACPISGPQHTSPSNPSDLVTLTSTNFRVEISLSATPKLNIMPIPINMLNGSGAQKREKVENFWKRRGMSIWNIHNNRHDDPDKPIFMPTK
jgi:hypothetical protein